MKDSNTLDKEKEQEFMSANTKSVGVNILFDRRDDYDAFSSYNQYGMSLPSIGIVKSFEKGVISVFEDCFDTCREIAIGKLTAMLFEKRKKEKENFNGIDRLRYVFFFNTRSKEGRIAAENLAKVGVKIVNAFERHVNFPLTHAWKVKGVVNDKGKELALKSTHFFVFVDAPRQWAKSPALASLHMLLMRLGRVQGMEKITNAKNNEVIDRLKVLSKKIDSEMTDDDDYEEFDYEMTEDIERVLKDIKYWFRALEGYDKYFLKKKFSTAYRLDDLSEETADDMCVYGIDSFIENKFRR
jgi:hypothetical protein